MRIMRELRFCSCTIVLLVPPDSSYTHLISEGVCFTFRASQNNSSKEKERHKGTSGQLGAGAGTDRKKNRNELYPQFSLSLFSRQLPKKKRQKENMRGGDGTRRDGSSNGNGNGGRDRYKTWDGTAFTAQFRLTPSAYAQGERRKGGTGTGDGTGQAQRDRHRNRDGASFAV
ncbi:hypothetical protein DFP73DRAFT_17453 [Morchella snyderi]|nr:hypothetical protein DFP73DRAFT_17453 [Morchella snyderi]